MSSAIAEVTVLDRAQREVTRPLTAGEIQAGVNLIQQVMRAVMKEGVHFGTIPGTPKPTLYKPGAEKICMTFRISTEPLNIEDLSNADEIRYRVTVAARSQASGVFLGSATGECSSSEAKYKWRAPVCQQEFDETPVDRRRELWKKGKEGPYKQKQVRTEPSDVANTILKMAHKRGLIAATLVVTAASDIFAQDIEDLPEELQHIVQDEAVGAPHITAEPRPAQKVEPPTEEEMRAGTEASDRERKPGVYVEAVRVIKTSKPDDEKQWKLYGVKLSNGVEYSTLKDALANIARTAITRKSAVSFTSGEYNGKQTLESLEEIR